MSARDELAELLHNVGGIGGMNSPRVNRAADAILAAGWRPPAEREWGSKHPEFGTHPCDKAWVDEHVSACDECRLVWRTAGEAAGEWQVAE